MQEKYSYSVYGVLGCSMPQNKVKAVGSGIRNLYKYTKIYSGGEPELIEGDIFKTIIPLARTSEKQANNDRITTGKLPKNMSKNEKTIINYLKAHGQGTVVDFADVLRLSKERIRAILREMATDGIIAKIGKTKSTYYVLK